MWRDQPSFSQRNKATKRAVGVDEKGVGNIKGSSLMGV